MATNKVEGMKKQQREKCWETRKTFMLHHKFSHSCAISLCFEQQWTLPAFIKNCAQLQKITEMNFPSQPLCRRFPAFSIPLLPFWTANEAQKTLLMIFAFVESCRGGSREWIEVQHNCVWSQPSEPPLMVRPSAAALFDSLKTRGSGQLANEFDILECFRFNC